MYILYNKSSMSCFHCCTKKLWFVFVNVLRHNDLRCCCAGIYFLINPFLSLHSPPRAAVPDVRRGAAGGGREAHHAGGQRHHAALCSGRRQPRTRHHLEAGRRGRHALHAGEHGVTGADGPDVNVCCNEVFRG